MRHLAEIPGYGPEARWIPPYSDSKRLIFPLHLDLGKFGIHSKIEQQTDNRMSQEEVNKFIEEIQKPMDEYHNKYKFIDLVGVPFLTSFVK